MMQVVYKDKLLTGEDHPLLVYIKKSELAETMKTLAAEEGKAPVEGAGKDAYAVFGLFPKGWTRIEMNGYIRNVGDLLNAEANKEAEKGGGSGDGKKDP